MVVWEGEAQKGGFGGGTLVTRGPPCPLAPHYRQPSATVGSGVAVLAHEPRGPLAAAHMIMQRGRQLQSARSAKSCNINRP